MTNDCRQISQMLGAYYDDELFESDRAAVEQHVSCCDSCANILKLYKTASASMEELNVPQGFTDSVMQEIKKQPRLKAVLGRRERAILIRRLLVRTLPVAACLAVLLTVRVILTSREASYDAGEITLQADTADMYTDEREESAVLTEPAPSAAMQDAPLMSGAVVAPGSVGMDNGYAEPETATSNLNGGESDRTSEYGMAAGTSGIPALPPAADAEAHKDTISEYGNFYATVTIIGAIPEILSDTPFRLYSDGTKTAQITKATALKLAELGFEYVAGDENLEVALVVIRSNGS